MRRGLYVWLRSLANRVDPDNWTCVCGHTKNEHLDDGYCPESGCGCAFYEPKDGWPKDEWEK